MSLINEALKRARVEAARRDAEAKGVPPEALPVYVPPRRRSWLAPALGFIAGLAVVAVAFGAFWVARQPAPAEQAPVTASIPTAAGTVEPAPPPAPAGATPPAAAPDPAAVPVPAPPVPSPSPEPRVAEPRSAEPAPKAPAPNLRSSEMPAPPPAAAATQASAVPPSPPEASAPAAPEEPPPSAVGEIPSYMRQASPAGAAVKIDFIVWSESRPFAQINGQLLSAGQSVGGYTLLKVERERVELEGGGQRFWLRVK